MTNRREPQIFYQAQRPRIFSWGDITALSLLALLLYLGVRLAFYAPSAIQGPSISLSLRALPWYTLLSVGRMTAAYALSMIFALLYGRAAAYHPRLEQLLMPLLDVLQSVPILSFLPVVLLSLSAVLPKNIATELASIVLIFTSQAWNLTFAWFQSLTTLPKELREASAVFRLNSWMRFKQLELPFGMISLVWNSVMSWAGGWFFLMAAEIFTVGQLDFRLPGLGAYLHEAASQSSFAAIRWGIAALVLTIILLDQLVWRPLIAWANNFKIEMVESDSPPTSWFYDLLVSSHILLWLRENFSSPLAERFDQAMLKRYPTQPDPHMGRTASNWPGAAWSLLFAAPLVYGLYHAGRMLLSVSASQWSQVGLGVLITMLRVLVALLIAAAWTIPFGVAIGTNRRLANIFQPLVQVIASIPATAIFPAAVLLMQNLPGGLNLAAVLLMLMGTQWYMLFNIIAGASAIPQDLKYTAELMRLNRWQRWRTLIVPAIFPYLITGAITASGGAWNASIVAEYQNFGGQTISAFGIGSLISQATAAGDYPLLLGATLSLVLTVILVNRLLWRRLYQVAEEKYRMEG